MKNDAKAKEKIWSGGYEKIEAVHMPMKATTCP